MELEFERIGILCKEIASKEVELEYCTLQIYLQPKTLVVAVKLPYNFDLKLEVKKEGCLKVLGFELRNFSLETFKRFSRIISYLRLLERWKAVTG